MKQVPAQHDVTAVSWGDEDDADDGNDLQESSKDDPGDDIPLSDIAKFSDTEEGDIIPHQRLIINNTSALSQAYNAIAVSIAKLPFYEHQIIVSAGPAKIPDVNDDLNRELVLHQQCLDAVREARHLLRKEGAPFSRPSDYFAEMIKSDEQMGRIKQRLTDEAVNRKAAAEAKKQRDLKKFGKQVQVAKLQERDKTKKDTLDKINILKRSELYIIAFKCLNRTPNRAQSGEAPTRVEQRRQTCLTLHLRTRTKQRKSPHPTYQDRIGELRLRDRRKTPSLALVGRKDSQKAATPSQLLILKLSLPKG